MASCVVGNPVSLTRLVYVDGQRAVINRGLKPNPRVQGNFVAMDLLGWLARMADHIPDPGRRRPLFDGHYANRARGARAKRQALAENSQEQGL